MSLSFQVRNRKAGGKPTGWMNLEVRVPRTSDAGKELAVLAKKHAAYLSGKGSIPNGYNPIRYCAIRRRYCMDRGRVMTVYELLVVVAGPAEATVHRHGQGRSGRFDLHPCHRGGRLSGTRHSFAMHVETYGEGG